jgi:ABC-type antimicrobial peptide transport system permease subunit
MLVDLEYAERSALGPTQLELEVWLAPGVAASELEPALAAAGFRTSTRDVLAERRAELDREGPALALLLFLVAALTALVLAVIAVATTVHIGARNRAYEIAALRTLGVRRRSLVAAVRREQLAFLGGGVVLGAVTGLAGAVLALPRLPLAAGAVNGPPPDYSPAWALLAALLLVAVALVVLVAHVAALLLVKAGVPELLREVQA